MYQGKLLTLVLSPSPLSPLYLSKKTLKKGQVTTLLLIDRHNRKRKKKKERGHRDREIGSVYDVDFS